MRHTDLQRRRPRALLRDPASTLGHLGRVLLDYGLSSILSRAGERSLCPRIPDEGREGPPAGVAAVDGPMLHFRLVKASVTILWPLAGPSAARCPRPARTLVLPKSSQTT